MNVQEVIEKVVVSEDYKFWLVENPAGFLAHVFVMTEIKDEYQVGYYDGTMMKTFLVSKTTVQGLPVDEILQTEHGVLPLAVEEATVAFEEAERLAREQLVLHYPRELALKTFFIVQTLPQPFGTVFNITFFCQSMRTVNIKMSAKDGTIIKHTCESLVDKL